MALAIVRAVPFSGLDAPAFSYSSGNKPASGNLVVVAFTQIENNGYAPTGVGDWTIDADSLTDNTAFVWKVWSDSDGLTDPFIDPTGPGNHWSAIAYEFSGANEAPIDASGSDQLEVITVAPFAINVTALTPAETGELPLCVAVILFFPDSASDALTPSSGWVVDQNGTTWHDVDDNILYDSMFAHGALTGSGAIGGSFTYGDPGVEEIIVQSSTILIKPAASTPPATGNILSAVPNLDWSFFTDTTVLIERRVQSGRNDFGEKTWSPDLLSVYSGLANVWDKTSGVTISHVGEIATETIMAIIDPSTSGYLPEVQKGDRLTITDPSDGTTSHKYLITHAHLWDFGPGSLEIEATLQKAW